MRFFSSARIAIVGTKRYAINANDFYMFYSKSKHRIAGVYLHRAIAEMPWFRRNAKKDKARLDCYLPFNEKDIVWWETDDQLVELLGKSKADYICLGNGNDESGLTVKKSFPREKLLCSEYGWFPWNEHFYITRYGTANDSDIAFMGTEEIDGMTGGGDGKSILKSLMQNGRAPLEGGGFVYVPLQVDKGDFKFGLTDFKTNAAFLDFIDRLVPEGREIWVRNHPLNKWPTDISKWKRMRDISGIDYSKFDIYSKMACMVVINSTSALEALAFDRPVFTYGKDIFSGKGVTWDSVESPEIFAQKMNEVPSAERAAKFIELLFRYQVHRGRCLSGDEGYIKNHHWVKSL